MNIFITGVNGYVGRNVAWTFLNAGHTVNGVDRADKPFEPRIGYIAGDLTHDSVIAMIFKRFSPDVVIHCAALVHAAGKNKPPEIWEAVNACLPERLAEAALDAGVKRFVFMSTLAVYGLETGHITADTPLLPNTPYGKSKLEAEKRLSKVLFGPSLLILRCPMIYGLGCPGNYQALRRIALKLPAVPNVKNARSLLYIGNLCTVLVALLEREASGVVFPQDPEYIETAAMMEAIRHFANKRKKEAHGLPRPDISLMDGAERNSHSDFNAQFGIPNRSRILGLGVKLAMFLTPAKKAFGSLTIDTALSNAWAPPCSLLDFDVCMRQTEGGSGELVKWPF